MLLWSAVLFATHSAQKVRWLMCKPFTGFFENGPIPMSCNNDVGKCVETPLVGKCVGTPLVGKCVGTPLAPLIGKCVGTPLEQASILHRVSHRATYINPHVALHVHATLWVHMCCANGKQTCMLDTQQQNHMCRGVTMLLSHRTPALQCAQYKQPKQPGPCECSAWFWQLPCQDSSPLGRPWHSSWSDDTCTACRRHQPEPCVPVWSRPWHLWST